MILYAENPKDFTKKLLELINEFSKVVGHKINTQKSVAFYMRIMNYLKGNYKNSQFPLKIHNCIHNCFKNNKNLRINLTKDVKDLLAN